MLKTSGVSLYLFTSTLITHKSVYRQMIIALKDDSYLVPDKKAH